MCSVNGQQSRLLRARLFNTVCHVPHGSIPIAIAYFITFTTYGTWLHGTEKGAGSVDRTHNQFETSFLTPGTTRLGQTQEAMAEPPYAMDAPRRMLVCDAIVEFAYEKGWRLWGVHVRSNHVHLIVSADREPGRLMSDVKARLSRELNRAGFDPSRTRWTRHGSTKHLFDLDAIETTIRYTLDEQGERMAHFDGRIKEPRTK